MKLLSIFIVFISVGIVSLSAQDKKPLSPPISFETSVEGVDITIDYSAPSMRGRTIYGDLVPFGQVWRTGANSATKITVSADVKIEGEVLLAGTYSIFTIPSADSWTIIFNKKASQWGAYGYSKADDALRVQVSPQNLEASVEQMVIEPSETGILLKWETTGVPISIGK